MAAEDDHVATVMVGGRVCEASATAWRDFAAFHGMSMTAFIDALGHMFADINHDLDEKPLLTAAIHSARAIDGKRRRRN